MTYLGRPDGELSLDQLRFHGLLPANPTKKENTMPTLTLKQVGDDVRARLKAAVSDGNLPGRDPSDRYNQVRYDVRVSRSKTGSNVNVTINGYEWLIPNIEDDGAAKKWKDTEGDALLYKVNQVVARYRYTREDGSVALGGDTKFGICLVSARVTGVTHVTYDGTETQYVLCDRCRTEIPKHGGARHSLAGPNGIEELCENCHEAEMTKGLSR